MGNEITTAKIYKQDIALAKELIASINAAMYRVENVMPTVTITIANMVHSALKLYAACVRKTMVAFPTIEFEQRVTEEYVVPWVLAVLTHFKIEFKTSINEDTGILSIDVKNSEVGHFDIPPAINSAPPLKAH